ncbi:cobalamin B12-binding domain-containing protein [Thermogladius sp. 4427co]|uniref:cobalamin B12-binding domain-containing protein n=1 Tax=Thermogladius sp. 4427co TaxID=3450718 RepID=UPI003F79A722
MLLDTINKCLVELNKECVLSNVVKALNEGIPASQIVLDAMSRAMEEIGRLYENGDYFIAELIEAASIFKEAMKILEPKLREEGSREKAFKRARIVLGTVKGDVHDIGKTLVAIMLQAAGHEVIDLGVDVPAEKFVEAVEKYKPDVLGMSALLTTTARYMRVVIEELEKKGLRQKVKIVVGGAATTPQFAREIGADGWAPNAIEAVKLIESLIS